MRKWFTLITFCACFSQCAFCTDCPGGTHTTISVDNATKTSIKWPQIYLHSSLAGDYLYNLFKGDGTVGPDNKGSATSDVKKTAAGYWPDDCISDLAGDDWWNASVCVNDEEYVLEYSSTDEKHDIDDYHDHLKMTLTISGKDVQAKLSSKDGSTDSVTFADVGKGCTKENINYFSSL